MSITRTYTELSKLKTWEERFEYLRLRGEVGLETFGFDRYLNQKFYNTTEWRRVRQEVIVRDMGGDLGLIEYPIGGRIYIHHMNPMRVGDLHSKNPDNLNPEYLVCVSHDTHNAIHYGVESPIHEFKERSPNDTTLW